MQRQPESHHPPGATHPHRRRSQSRQTLHDHAPSFLAESCRTRAQRRREAARVRTLTGHGSRCEPHEAHSCSTARVEIVPACDNDAGCGSWYHAAITLEISSVLLRNPKRWQNREVSDRATTFRHDTAMAVNVAEPSAVSRPCVGSADTPSAGGSASAD